MDQQYNFIDGAKYNQIGLEGEYKDRPLDEILQFGSEMSMDRGAWIFLSVALKRS
jgi:hypothetical protein